jgi:hypothetical protein
MNEPPPTFSLRDCNAIVVIQPEAGTATRPIQPEHGIPARELANRDAVTVRKRPTSVAADSTVPPHAVRCLAGLHVRCWRGSDRGTGRRRCGSTRNGGDGRRRGRRTTAATGDTDAISVVGPETAGAVGADGRVPC